MFTSCPCTHRYTFRYTVQSTQTLGGGHIRFAYPMYTLKLYTTSVQAKISNAVNTGVKTWLDETKFVF